MLFLLSSWVLSSPSVAQMSNPDFPGQWQDSSQANPKVVRWAPLIVDGLRAEGVPESQIPTALALTLSLIRFESGGNPSAEHGVTSRARNPTNAYGLTQQIKRWHPRGVHRGNPRAHLRYFASRYRVNTRPGGAVANHPVTFLMLWASGNKAVEQYIKDKSLRHEKVFRHLRNIQTMSAGKTWRIYSSWVHGWIADGQPTSMQTVEGNRYELAGPNVSKQTALASPWDGYLRYRGKSRKVGDAGPGGATGVLAKLSGTSSQTTIMWAVIVLLLGGAYVVWRGGR